MNPDTTHLRQILAKPTPENRAVLGFAMNPNTARFSGVGLANI
jgi:hypothetical protein